MNAFEKINQLNEADSFKQLIRKWDRLYENMQAFPYEKPIILPDILWVAPPGSGRTTLIQLMAEYLKEKPRLMEFFGQVDYFEFMLSYCSPEEPMTELKRFMEEVYWAAGFRNEFKGIININVSEWLEHFEEKNFLLFLEYLSVNSRYWLTILSVEKDDIDAVHQMESVVSMYLRIERIEIEAPKTESLLKNAADILEDYGLTLSDDAAALLTETIDVLKQNKYFYGYKTVEMLVQDIIYECMSANPLKKQVLTAENLRAFSSNSEYVKKAVQAKQHLNQIGFRVNGEE